MVRHTELLMEQIGRRASAGEPVNFENLAAYYSFDLMGVLTYSESFRMLENNKTHEYLTIIKKGLAVVGLFVLVPWLVPLLRSLPIISQADTHAHRFLASVANKRIDLDEGKGKVPPNGRDVFYWVLKSYREGVHRPWKTKTNIYADAYLITIAGRYVSIPCCVIFTSCTLSVYITWELYKMTR